MTDGEFILGVKRCYEANGTAVGYAMDPMARSHFQNEADALTYLGGRNAARRIKLSDH